jgi:type IV pilus assembly protein PilY1
MNLHKLTYIKTLVIASLLATPVVADDTDIFIVNSDGAATYQPNVLMVFDTSGSMRTNITTTVREDYNPAADYGTVDHPTRIYVYNSSLTTEIDYIIPSQNNCDTMINQIAARVAANSGDPTWYGQAGYYLDYGDFGYPPRYDRYNSWRNVTSSWIYKTTSTVDCKADEAVAIAAITAGTISSFDEFARNGNSNKYSTTARNVWDNLNNYFYVSAHYSKWLKTGTSTTRSRQAIMIDEAQDLIDNFSGLNMGLMRLNRNSNGGSVVRHFADLSVQAEKDAMKVVVGNLPASGTTPLAETLWEAGRYYSGLSPDYGGSSVSSSITGGKYNSPIENSCQKNYIVMLTDGQPTNDTGRNSQISGLTGVGSCPSSGSTGTAAVTCLDEMAGYLATEDVFAGLDGEQNVNTYTIGFDINLDLLDKAAQAGQGQYYTAGNSTELKAAFTEIIASILDTNTTFTAPAVTVNAYNNLQHRNELYYAIFKPRASPQWAGNIKRYQINSDGTVSDVNDNNAIDDTSGFFQSGAKSWWSAVTDGGVVENGGFAEQLQSTRKVYTYTGTATPSNTALNVASNLLTTTNTAITNELMGLETATPDTFRNKLIEWIQGEDVDGVDPDDNYHNFIADPLHTRPVVVTYGGNEATSDDTVFSMTNVGALHAIDSDDGSEVFSFVPKELLPNINTYYEDASSLNKVYGLDGAITVWRNESDDADFTIEAADNDHVYLYLGMRRGGSDYYAMDVTDRANPKLMWQIKGGLDGDPDFADLGQTWSTPKLSKVKWDCDSDGANCTYKVVLIFAGGYDTTHDSATAPTTSDIGNAIYMVDATTGALLWSAGKAASHDLTLTTMENSIPSDVVTGDIDGDGSIDVIFANDIMGHVWRFDINAATQSASDFATGGMIANFAGTTSTTLKRFYNSPDIALFTPRGHSAFFTLSTGSGYRANPKEELINDRFYTLFLDDVFGPPLDEDSDSATFGDVLYTTLTDSDMFNATSTAANKYENAMDGYYISIAGTGEKVLSNSLTFGGMTYFTSYLTQGATNLCGVDIGSGLLYAINILTGEGLIDDERTLELKHGGIAAAPVLIFTKNDDGSTTPILCVGTECFKDGDEDLPIDSVPLLQKTYWLEQ